MISEIGLFARDKVLQAAWAVSLQLDLGKSSSLVWSLHLQINTSSVGL